MAQSKTYTVRPFSKPIRSDKKDLFRVYVSPSSTLLLGLHAGDPCTLHGPHGFLGCAIIWPASEKILDSVIQTSNTLQTLYGVKLGDKISITEKHAPLPDAKSIVLREATSDESKISLPSLRGIERPHWAWLLEHALKKAEFLSPGVVFDHVEAKDQKRSFRVQEVNSSSELILYRFHPSCTTQICDEHPLVGDLCEGGNQTLRITNHGVGGLDAQVEQLNNEIASYSRLGDGYRMPKWYQQRQGGILLHGPSGTGKSLVLKKVSEAGWQAVFYINEDELSSSPAGGFAARIRKIFSDAQMHQPSVIVIDDLESIAPRQDYQGAGQANRIGRVLGKEIERLGNSHTLVVAAARALANIDQDLRQFNRFWCEIEIPVPDLKSRAAILRVLNELPKNAKNAAMDDLASHTHGFVGSDLKRLLYSAARKAKARNKSSNFGNGCDLLSRESDILVEVSEIDTTAALQEVRPTAMREIFVETPEIEWNDIGGQEEVKKNLERAIIWPFKHSGEMKRLGIEPKKGLLLYGPPGCSKTMTAKAVATESGHNFIAVKGAELLSMYVGESERAVRELFSKARSVSPSIIFFDEIDAIGTARDNGQHGGVNIVTTLLNELDGIEELKGVFVLAATNRPEVVDPALIRAGRLDTMLYVGPPDTKARLHIIRKRLQVMDVTDDVDESKLADATDGYSGAELVSICQRAGEAALDDQMDAKEQRSVSRKHFDQALMDMQTIITPEMIASYQKFAMRTRHGAVTP